MRETRFEMVSVARRVHICLPRAKEIRRGLDLHDPAKGPSEHDAVIVTLVFASAEAAMELLP